MIEVLIVLLLGTIIANNIDRIKEKFSNRNTQTKQKQIYQENTEKKEFKYYYTFEKKEIMSNEEKIFYKYLRNKLKPNLIIFPQANLSTFVKCKYDWCYRNDKNPENTIYNKIAKKTVDYLITDYEFNPVVIIELDGNSHGIEERIKRDEFVDRVAQTIKIPIAHINKYNSYNDEISVKLKEYLIGDTPTPDN